jgi:addiction module antitoxin, RelB/DinJ family
MALVQIRLTEKLKDQAQKTAEGMGMDLSTAIRVFLTQMVNDGGLPFKPAASQSKDQEALRAYSQSVEQFDQLYEKLSNS